MSARVLIADDHKIMRDGLKALLEKIPGIEVVAEADNGRMVMQIIEQARPNIILMDISMPDTNGIEATQKILQKYPNVKILALSMHSDKKFVGDMLRAGASGYLLKDCAQEELVRAIQTLMSNQTFLSPQIAGVVADGFIHGTGGKAGSTARSLLTARELEVLQLMAEGKATKEIAFDLQVSIKTVETYRQKLMEKLNLHSVAELTKYAVREGLTSLES